MRLLGGSGGRSRKMAILFGQVLMVVVYYVFMSTSKVLEERRRANTYGGAEMGPYNSGRTLTSSSVVPNNGQLSRWGHKDWLPQRDKEVLLRGYKSHFENPHHAERFISCGSKDADEANKAAVTKVLRHISFDYINPTRELNDAAAALRQVLEKYPSCPTIILNYVIVATVTIPTKDQEQLEGLLKKIPHGHKLYLKSKFWLAVVQEYQGKDKEAHDVYTAVFEEDSEYSKTYFGKYKSFFFDHQRQITLFGDNRLKREDAKLVEKEAVIKLVLYYEYAPHFAGYAHVSPEEMLAFHDVWYHFVKGMVPPYVTQVLQQCLRKLIDMGALRFDDKQSKRYFHYNPPFVRFMSAVYVKLIGMIFAMEMKSTYTYLGSYPGGSELKPHVDRAQCEITVTVSVDVNPGEGSCPIGLRLEPKKLLKEKSVGNALKPTDPSLVQYVYPRPGDALMIRGRGLVHWRDPIPDGMNCSNIFLHYVRSDFVGKQD
eukprot:TRINITY_DN17414_c1_g1_i2.p1 TRINITY_DN17414_c1_g1~~TRINITY_DN17414_c1_g1_i2.p1  ORF type:complete len:485 (+),score=78.24 TRINITY_DN17414_c1_g1_i2:59-1513(+)